VAHAAERMMRAAFHGLGISMTVGSASIVDAWDTLRPAGAAARALLMAAAARRWAVPVARLETLRGQVVDRESGRNASYGELAADAARERVPDAVLPKDPATYRLVGTSPRRLDLPAKVTGVAQFGIDTRHPGMLFATVRHSPLLGTRIAGVDNSFEVSGMPGVEGVVRLGSEAVAVVARDTWSAMRGAARLSLKPEPTDTPSPDGEAIMADWHRGLDDPDPAVFREAGDARAALAASPAVIEAVYELPWLAHLCMEPMNCAALVEPDGVTVWAPTQAESMARNVAASVAGVSAADVTVHRTFLGGGFGRRSEMDFVSHAVGAAQAFPGRAVKLTYSREEDLRADRFRPAAVARVRGVLDGAGRLQAMDYVFVSQSVLADFTSRNPMPGPANARRDRSALAGAADLCYAPIANLRFAFVPRKVPVPAGFWRSVGNSQNGFIVESFMDELAAAAGQDPVAFRLAHLAERPAHQAVLREAARRAGWDTPPGPGRGRGVALVESQDSIVAQVIEVTAGAGADVRVDRVVCVIDPRVVIHPDIVIAQMEGSILDGLAAALHGRITISGGSVEQSNFDNYRLLRLAETPVIEVFLLPQGGRPGGVGEPGVPAVAPALANAIFAATGKRIRRLPISRRV
jgi:isoquinoline 1-oxidoreductase beta subunit